jgi:putative transposase
MRWHSDYPTLGSGHVNQGRFQSFPVQENEHFYHVLRYVERNARRANLVQHAEDWR